MKLVVFYVNQQDDNEDDAVSEVQLAAATFCHLGNHRLTLDEEMELMQIFLFCACGDQILCATFCKSLVVWLIFA